MPLNINNFIRSLHQDAMPRLRATLVSALNDFGRIVIDAASPLVPYKTGDLQESNYLDKAGEGGRGLCVTVGYGSGDVDYAEWVHELNISKNGNPIVHSQGQWKFLETAMLASAPDLMPYIANRLNVEFKS